MAVSTPEGLMTLPQEVQPYYSTFARFITNDFKINFSLVRVAKFARTIFPSDLDADEYLVDQIIFPDVQSDTHDIESYTSDLTDSFPLFTQDDFHPPPKIIMPELPPTPPKNVIQTSFGGEIGKLLHYIWDYINKIVDLETAEHEVRFPGQTFTYTRPIDVTAIHLDQAVSNNFYVIMDDLDLPHKFHLIGPMGRVNVFSIWNYVDFYETQRIIELFIEQGIADGLITRIDPPPQVCTVDNDCHSKTIKDIFQTPIDRPDKIAVFLITPPWDRPIHPHVIFDKIKSPSLEAANASHALMDMRSKLDHENEQEHHEQDDLD
jgi:hypothetical protein